MLKCLSSLSFWIKLTFWINIIAITVLLILRMDYIEETDRVIMLVIIVSLTLHHFFRTEYLEKKITSLLPNK